MDRGTYKVILSGILIGLSIVLTRVFSANLPIAGVPAARLAVGFLPIMLASIIVGPYFGIAVGALADALGFLLFPSGVYFPLITLTSALVGLLPYLIYHMAAKLKEWLKVLLAVSVTQIICSMFLQTLWLSILYGKAFIVLFPERAIVVLITIPVYSILVYSILIGLRKANLLKSLK